MKKFLLALVVTLLMVPFVTAYAEETPAPTAKPAKLTEEQKATLTAEKAKLKSIHQTNAALRASIKDERAQIKSLIASLKSAGTEEAKAKIENAKKILADLQVKAERGSLRSLRDAGKPYWAQFKTNIKAKDVNAAVANLESIASVRTSRTEHLTAIDNALKQVLNALK